MLSLNNFAKPNGFSLPELLMAAGLSFLVVLASAVLIENLLGEDRAIKGALTADAQLDQADFIIQRYFRSAVDVKQTSSSLTGQSLTSGGEGLMMKSFDSDPAGGPFPTENTITPLALFYRDTAVITGVLADSSLKATGLYFQQPGPDNYGVLYIDDGINGTTLGPSTSNAIVDHITSLQLGSITSTVMPVGGSTPAYVRSFQITLTIRLPTYTNGNDAMNWCGPNRTATDASCRTGQIPFKDTVRTLTVILYNNYDPQATPADGPALGRIYFAR